jgi:hypothetical protein
VVDFQVLGNVLKFWINGVPGADASGNKTFNLSEATANYLTFYSAADPGTSTLKTFVDEFDFSAPPPPPVPPAVQLSISKTDEENVAITWPAVGNYLLESADLAEGPWNPAGLQVAPDANGNNVASDALSAAARFYRLVAL